MIRTIRATIAWSAFLLAFPFIIAQSQTYECYLWLDPVSVSNDSILLVAKMKNMSSHSLVLESVRLTLNFAGDKLRADSAAICNPFFARLGWISDHVIGTFNDPSNSDTITYCETSPTAGVGITIPPNAPVILCTITLFPLKGSNDIGSMFILGNDSTTGQTGYKHAGSSQSVPFLCFGGYHAMPVKYRAFSAGQMEQSIALQWTTIYEESISGFIIERRNAADSVLSWTQIGFVAGMGISPTDHTYTFQDDALTESGEYMYRLREQYYSGGTSEGPETVAKFEYIPQSLALYPIAPNPVLLSSGTPISFRFTLPERSVVRIHLMNSGGRIVAEAVSGEFGRGDNDIAWRPEQLAAGVYFVVLDAYGVQSNVHLQATGRFTALR